MVRAAAGEETKEIWHIFEIETSTTRMTALEGNFYNKSKVTCDSNQIPQSKCVEVNRKAILTGNHQKCIRLLHGQMELSIHRGRPLHHRHDRFPEHHDRRSSKTGICILT